MSNAMVITFAGEILPKSDLSQNSFDLYYYVINVVTGP